MRLGEEGPGVSAKPEFCCDAGMGGSIHGPNTSAETTPAEKQAASSSKIFAVRIALPLESGHKSVAPCKRTLWIQRRAAAIEPPHSSQRTWDSPNSRRRPCHAATATRNKKGCVATDERYAPQPLISQSPGRLRRVESLRDWRGSGVLLHLPSGDPGQR